MTTYPNISSVQKILALHYLRGIAALMVMAFHLIFWNAHQYSLGWEISIGNNLDLPIVGVEYSDSLMKYWSPIIFLKKIFYLPDLSVGAVGVAIFFLITGFVIPLAIDRYKMNSSEFLITRFCRIYPTYIATSFLMIGLLWLLNLFFREGIFDAFSLERILINLTLFQDFLKIQSINEAAWTLMVEIKFYLLSGLIILCGKNYNGKNVSIILLITVLLNVLYSYFKSDGEISFLLEVAVFNLNHICYILIGTSIYLIQRDRKKPESYALLIATGLIFYFGFTRFFDKSAISPFFARGSALEMHPSEIALAIFIGSLLLAGKGTKSKILNFFSDISYPLYLSHMILGNLVISEMLKITHNIHFSLAISSSTIILISYLIHISIEKPSNIFGKKLINKNS